MAPKKKLPSQSNESTGTVASDVSLPYPCLVCGKDADLSEGGGCALSIQCGLCKSWCHFGCAGIDKTTSENYVKNKKLHWFCMSCEPHAISVLDRVKILESNSDKHYKELKSSVKCLTTSVDTKLESTKALLENKLAELKTELITTIQSTATNSEPSVTTTYAEKLKTEIDKSVIEQITALKSDLTQNIVSPSNAPTNGSASVLPTDNIRAEVREQISEKDRIDKKKRNLIFSNIKESGSVKEDEETVKKIIADKLMISEVVTVTSVARLGRRNDDPDTNRLLKVSFESLQHKKMVLRKATQLRSLDENDAFHNIYIRPDLTKLQIEHSKNLTAQLRQMRDDNVPGKWIIRRGAIINLDSPEPENKDP